MLVTLMACNSDEVGCIQRQSLLRFNLDKTFFLLNFPVLALNMKIYRLLLVNFRIQSRNYWMENFIFGLVFRSRPTCSVKLVI